MHKLQLDKIKGTTEPPEVLILSVNFSTVSLGKHLTYAAEKSNSCLVELSKALYIDAYAAKKLVKLVKPYLTKEKKYTGESLIAPVSIARKVSNSIHSIVHVKLKTKDELDESLQVQKDMELLFSQIECQESMLKNKGHLENCCKSLQLPVSERT